MTKICVEMPAREIYMKALVDSRQTSEHTEKSQCKQGNIRQNITLKIFCY